MMKRHAGWAAFVGLALACSAAFGADWPQWRGERRDNKSSEKGLVKQWPAGGPKLAWRGEGLGKGYSSVAVVGGRIYTMGDEGEDSFVRALAENGGKEIWKTKIGPAGESGRYYGPRSTPTVDGEFVYVLGREGEVACLEAKTGKVVWSRHLRNDFGGRTPNWGYAESVLVDGDRVVCTPGGPNGTVVALDRRSGKELWRSGEWTDPAHYSSMVIADLAGVRQYVQFTPESVGGVSPADGKLLWRAERKGKTAVIPTPVWKDNLVFVSSGYGVGCNLFAVEKSGGGGGSALGARQVYAGTQMTNHHGGLVLVGEHVYGVDDSGRLKCIEMKSGREVWQDRCVAMKGSVTFADGMLIVRGEDRDGPVVLVEATPAGYRERGRFAQPDRRREKSWPHPVVANGKLYLRDQELLLCYDVAGK